MTKRGVLFENELRYLSPTQRATLVYDLIAKDREFGESREFSAVRYEFASPSGFAAGINYNRASDDRYFVDFGTTIVDTSQKVLPQDGYSYNLLTVYRRTVRENCCRPRSVAALAKPTNVAQLLSMLHFLLARLRSGCGLEARGSSSSLEKFISI